MPAISHIIWFVVGIIVLVFFLFIAFQITKTKIPMIPYPIDRDTAYALTSTAALTCAVDYAATKDQYVQSCYRSINFDILETQETKERYDIFVPYAKAQPAIVECGIVGSNSTHLFYRCTSIYKDSVNVICEKNNEKCKVIRFYLPQYAPVFSGSEFLDSIIFYIWGKVSDIPIANKIVDILNKITLQGLFWGACEVSKSNTILKFYVCFVQAFGHPRFIVTYEKLDMGTEDWWEQRNEPHEWAVVSILMGGFTNIIPVSKAGAAKAINLFLHPIKSAKAFSSSIKIAYRKGWKGIAESLKNKVMKAYLPLKLLAGRLAEKQKVSSLIIEDAMKMITNNMKEDAIKRDTFDLMKRIVNLRKGDKITYESGNIIFSVDGETFSKNFLESFHDRFKNFRVKNIEELESNSFKEEIKSMIIESFSPYPEEIKEGLANALVNKMGKKDLDELSDGIRKELVNDFEISKIRNEESFIGKTQNFNWLNDEDKEELAKILIEKISTDSEEFNKLVDLFAPRQLMKRFFDDKGTLKSVYNALKVLPDKEAKKFAQIIDDYTTAGVEHALYEIKFLRSTVGDDATKNLLERIGGKIKERIERAWYEKKYFGTYCYHMQHAFLTALGAVEDVPLGLPGILKDCNFCSTEALDAAKCTAGYALFTVPMIAITEVMDDVISSNPYEPCDGNSMCLYTQFFYLFKDSFNFSMEKSGNAFVTVKLENMDWFGFGDRYNRAWLVSPCEADLNIEYSPSGLIKCDRFYAGDKLYYEVQAQRQACMCLVNVTYTSSELRENEIKVENYNNNCPTSDKLNDEDKKNCGYIPTTVSSGEAGYTITNATPNPYWKIVNDDISWEKIDSKIKNTFYQKIFYVDKKSCDKKGLTLIDCAINNALGKCSNNDECNLLSSYFSNFNLTIVPKNYDVVNGVEKVYSNCESSTFTFATGSPPPGGQVIISVDRDSMKNYWNDRKIPGINDELQPHRNYCVPNGGKIENIAKNTCELANIIGGLILTPFTGGISATAVLFALGSISEACGWLTANTNIWPTNQFS